MLWKSRTFSSLPKAQLLELFSWSGMWLLKTKVLPPCGVCFPHSRPSIHRFSAFKFHQTADTHSDCHFRIGGAAGSRLQAANCPKLTGAVNNNCIAGSLMLHMKPSSSGYLENVWAWVADHDLDSGPAQTQIDVYVARGSSPPARHPVIVTNTSSEGMLIESTGGPTWLYGTASEHSVLYQYMIYGAKDIFLGMVCPLPRPPSRSWLLTGLDTNGESLLPAQPSGPGPIHRPSRSISRRPNLLRLPCLQHPLRSRLGSDDLWVNKHTHSRRWFV